MARTIAGFLIVVLLAVAGCGSEPAPDPPPPVPRELAGTWTMVTPDGNAFSYDISAAGTYVHAAIMTSGTQQYTVQESGSAEVDGTRITFRPASVTVTRSDTSVPAGNYRSATARPPRTLDWALTGNELTLGAEVFVRE